MVNLILIVVLASSTQIALAGKGSCRAAKKCCDGKDSQCLAQNVNVNELIEDLDEYVEPCYCDHGCLDVGDCCPDFKDYCGGKKKS